MLKISIFVYTDPINPLFVLSSAIDVLDCAFCQHGLGVVLEVGPLNKIGMHFHCHLDVTRVLEGVMYVIDGTETVQWWWWWWLWWWWRHVKDSLSAPLAIARGIH